MTIPPTPQTRPLSNRGFTLIELLVVIAIIALLTSITIPIYNMVNSATNSSRSLANLKSIGTSVSVYAAENNNFLPIIEGTEPLDWTNVEIDLDEAILEKLPSWQAALIHHAARNGADLTQRVFSCPGMRWKDGSGDKIPTEDILLAYGVTDAVNGFDEDNELSPLVARNLATIENKPNTILVLETKQDGSTPLSYPHVTWTEAKRDFSRPSPSESKLVDFRFKKQVNCLMADGSARGYRQKDKRDLEEPNWTGEDYDSLRR